MWPQCRPRSFRSSVPRTFVVAHVRLRKVVVGIAIGDRLSTVEYFVAKFLLKCVAGIAICDRLSCFCFGLDVIFSWTYLALARLGLKCLLASSKV